jgi:hypothetical protein
MFDFFSFHLLCRERVPITGQKMAAQCRLQDRRWLPAQVIRDSVISVILAAFALRHGNDVVAGDSSAFLLQVCCTLGNA